MQTSDQTSLNVLSPLHWAVNLYKRLMYEVDQRSVYKSQKPFSLRKWLKLKSLARFRHSFESGGKKTKKNLIPFSHCHIEFAHLLYVRGIVMPPHQKYCTSMKLHRARPLLRKNLQVFTVCTCVWRELPKVCHFSLNQTLTSKYRLP